MAKSEDTPSYEPAGVTRPWLIASIVGVSIMLIAATMAGVYLLYLPVARKGPITFSQFSAPRLQLNPSMDLAVLERAQQSRLSTVKWLDGGKSELSIPIAAAMKAIAARRSEAFDPLPNAPAQEIRSRDRPVGAAAPKTRRDNPGSGAPRMMEAPR